MQTQFLEYEGCRYAYQKKEHSSEKPWAIFIHGLGADLAAWQKQSDFFYKKGYNILMMDLNGHGKSDIIKDYNFFSIQNNAKTIERLIQKLRITRFFLIGHCYGGAIAVRLALDYDMKPEGLCIIGSSPINYYPKIYSISKQVLKRLESTKHVQKERQTYRKYNKIVGYKDYSIRRVIYAIYKTKPYPYLATLSNFLNWDIVEELHNIKVPTYVIVGSNDKIFNRQKSKIIAQHIANSVYAEIDNTEHVTVLHDPQKIYDIMTGHDYKKEEATSYFPFLQKLNLRRTRGLT